MAVVEQTIGRAASVSDAPAETWVNTVDHKRLGLLYITMALVFMVVAGVEALIMRWQLLQPRGEIVGPELFNQLFTMHGTTMVFFVGMPILIGLGNYLVPLMIGARDMAFPRLNALGFWLTLFAGLFTYYSFFAGGAPAIGWFAYAPLTEYTFSRGYATDYWIIGLLISGIGTIAAGVNFVTTILTMRAPGMTLGRVPLFVWMMLFDAVLILIALPPLTASQIMLLFDRQLGAHFFDVQGGGSALLWQHLFWFFGHPEVYILILPAFGAVSEIIPVFSRKPIFGYESVAAATVAIAFISVGVWAHHMFAVGMNRTLDWIFAGATMLIAVPTGIKMFNWIATLYGGRLVLAAPMLFSLGFLGTFVIGGLTGIMLATVPIDWQVTDSYFVVGHFHYVLIGGTLFCVLAAVYYWFPKATGRMLSERLGRWHFWLMLIGFNLTFGPMHIAGLLGMPRRVYTYEPGRGWEFWNQLTTLGALVQAVAFAIFFWNVAVSLRRGKPAGSDPWNAWTLEWATASPPPSYNFDVIPPVYSRRPVWDLKHPHDADWKHEGTESTPTLVPTATFDHGKTGMLVFLVSEVAFFSTLIVAYIVFMGRATSGPTPAILKLPLAVLGTVCLLASSATVHLATGALHRGRRLIFCLAWTLTILLGAGFLGLTAYEWRDLIQVHGLTIGSNVFGTTYYTLVGFHAAHVSIGVLLMTLWLAIALFGGRAATPARTEVIAYYWHFVDAVWIVVFTLVYLISR